MTKVLFSFDTEDYINPKGADGILRCAELLRKHGIRGCFETVAWLAQALVEWGRQDVLDALGHHEISFHSLSHTWHPTINEYTDLEDYDAALALFLEKETEGVRILSEIFGVTDFPSACPPGDSTSYVAHYGYAQMGFQLYSGDHVFDAKASRPVGICNMLSIDYTQCLDTILLQKDREELRALLDQIAETRDVCVLYHHPQKGIITEFCDVLNQKGYNTPKEQWILSEIRPEEEQKRFYENFEYLVETLLQDPRFELVTYADLREQYAAAARTVYRKDIPALKTQLEEAFFPVTVPDSYCLSDLLLACRDFLHGAEAHLCGTVYGFLSKPFAITEPVTLTAQEVKEAGAAFGEGFLPEQITVGGKVIGPADWLRAAMEVLCGAETVTVNPGPWQIDLDQFPRLRDLTYKGSWMHSPELEDKYLSDRLRLQSWTIRLPKGTERMIW